MLSNYLLFTLKEKKAKHPVIKGNTNTVMGYARIDLKKMYDNMSLSDL